MYNSERIVYQERRLIFPATSIYELHLTFFDSQSFMVYPISQFLYF